MITPVMITNIGWGTYLFFAVMNACFIPIIWFWYPETKRRSLEEIDIIFAKGYVEKISYVKAAQDLPYLTDLEVEKEALKYGLIDEPSAVFASGKEGSEGSAVVVERKVHDHDAERLSDEATVGL